jgi:hypothetical protein
VLLRVCLAKLVRRGLLTHCRDDGIEACSPGTFRLILCHQGGGIT